jgi:hypothetical protein
MEKPSLQQLLDACTRFIKKFEEVGVAVLMESLKFQEYVEIMKAIGEVKLQDFGFTEVELNGLFLPGQITCMTLSNSPMIGIGLFFMSEGTEFPVHDHPGMVVTSKLLTGTIHRKSFDLLEMAKQFELPVLVSQGKGATLDDKART